MKIVNEEIELATSVKYLQVKHDILLKFGKIIFVVKYLKSYIVFLRLSNYISLSLRLLFIYLLYFK